MTSHEHPKEPSITARQLDIQDFVTLTGHRYVRTHRSRNGWEEEHGFLERRRNVRPVAVERRNHASCGP